MLSKNIDENVKLAKSTFAVDKSFDIIGRHWHVGNKRAYMVYIDGFTKDQVMLYIMNLLSETASLNLSVESLLSKKIPYIEVGKFEKIEDAIKPVLSGNVALFIDGLDKGILIDVREYPVRSSEEPDLERVTRGARDGLVETIIFNTALIRRRVRDPNLIFEMKNVGTSSKTDVAIGYIDNIVDKDLINIIKEKVENIDVNALVMAEKTLEELIIKKKWYNPFPQVRFSERPDVVAAHLLEGHIAIIVDTSPSVMLLPVTFFHFTQHAEDYYQNPMIGTYIRWIRFTAMFISFALTPIWLLLVMNKGILPEFLAFLGPKEASEIPLFLQFIILEIGIDFLRIASIHTPNALSTSLGIIGALVLSEFAVKVGWFVPESILYMAIAGIGTFAIPSIEFSMALRIFRLFLLIITGLLNWVGFLIGMLIIIVISANTRTFDGRSYFWPLIPFDGKSLINIIFRKPIPQIGQRK